MNISSTDPQAVFASFQAVTASLATAVADEAYKRKVFDECQESALDKAWEFIGEVPDMAAKNKLDAVMSWSSEILQCLGLPPTRLQQAIAGTVVHWTP